MKTKLKKLCSLTLAGILTVSVLSACGKPKQNNADLDSPEKYGSEYPLKTNGDKLSLWLINSVHNEYKSYQDMPFFKETQKRTGVKLDVQGPTGGQFEESFNLMIASGELPDIILYDWADKKVAGGPAKYIKDGYIRDLTKVINKYAPNLKKILKENPELDKAVKTDEGQYYVFPYMNLTKPATYAGPIVRKDWLDDLGLEVPTTIDEWHTMLTEFKDKKGSTSPLLYIDWLLESTGFLSGAYGTQQGYYLNENKELEYGPATEKWKQFLEMMHTWYDEGLIDKDIATIDSTTRQSKVVSGKNGAFLGSGGDMGTFIPLIEKVDPKAKFEGVPYPTLNKGETPEFGICDLKYSGLMSSAITADCENVELAAQICKNALDPAKVLEQVGLGGRMNNFPAQLSGGEQQRVSIARALAKNPKLLLCDEPTGALDYNTGKTILALLQKTCRENGMTVIVITHNQAITPMADRVITMKNSKVSNIVLNPDPAPVEEIEW